MADLSLAALADLPNLPGDFQQLDYDEEEEDTILDNQRIPFSNLKNLPGSDHRFDGLGDTKPSWGDIKESIFMDLDQEDADLTLGGGLDIDCREEVVFTKGLSPRGPGKFLSPSPRPKEPVMRTCSGGVSASIPPVTPTKPDLENIDPLTPTTNLKILSSVVSPEIRRQNERKERRFKELLAVTLDDRLNQRMTTAPPQLEKQKIIVPDMVKENSRKAKSLGLLCERFLEMYQRRDGSGLQDGPQDISLDIIAKDLNVERRRIYDIINVLESVEMVSRRAKNKYVWHGQGNLMEVLKKLKFLGAEYRYNDQLELLRRLERDKEVGVKGEFITGLHPLSDPANRLPVTEEDGKKEKSLGVMSQKFIMLFLQPVNKTITLETAARVLYGELCEDIANDPKFKTKVRRLYDIANVLGSLKLIRKVHIQEVRGRKPAFEWIGPSPDIEGYKPDNLQTLFNQEKKPTPTEASRSRKRSEKGKSPRLGWGRHHSFNALPQGRLMEPREPRSLPSSPGKQPPTPITDSSEFQNELIALCTKYPGQMHQFLTTPPAGSIASPATARKLLMPSPSAPAIFQSEQFPEGAIIKMEATENGESGEGSSNTLPGMKTLLVQRFLPVLTPETLLQLQQAQGSPSCGSVGGYPQHGGNPPPGAEGNSPVVGQNGVLVNSTTTALPGANVVGENGALVSGPMTPSGVTLATSSGGKRPGHTSVGRQSSGTSGNTSMVSQQGALLKNSVVHSAPGVVATSSGKLPRNLVLVSPMPGTGPSPATQNSTPVTGSAAATPCTHSANRAVSSTQIGTTVSLVASARSGHSAHQGASRAHPGANTIICTGAWNNTKRRSPKQTNEYQAVMKQLKVIHQPGGLMTSGESPSPQSTLGESPMGDRATSDSSTSGMDQPRMEQSVAQCSVETNNNGWYDDPIVFTPSVARHKKRQKRGHKRARKDRVKKARKRERHTKMRVRDSDGTPPLVNGGVDHVRRQLLPPSSVSTPQRSSLRSHDLFHLDPTEATPPSIQGKDPCKQKRQLFRHQRSKVKSTKSGPAESREDHAAEKDFPPVLVEAVMESPITWLHRDTPTPASSLKSSIGSQEFDQMLRNNVGSPLMSLFPSQPQDSATLGISPCSLPNFVCSAQQRDASTLPNPTPLAPTSLFASVHLPLATSEESCWPMVVPVSFPVLVPGHSSVVGMEQARAGRRIKPDSSNGYRTAFEFVSRTHEQAV